ncbi:MAG: ABC transporter permease [Gemmatimonadetes bacterium]|nr:ABC transporter permease [Gemmatimonadota bacterium]
MALGISIIVFAVIQAAPGGPETMLFQSGRIVDEAAVEAYRNRLGLDQPVPVQYVRWLGAAVTGDLGMSFARNRPVKDVILEHLPATLELMGAAFVLAAVLALGLGVVSAVRQYSWIDHLGTGLSFAGIAMPVFWFGLILQLVFAVQLGWLPASGRQTTGVNTLPDHLAHLILPGVVLSMRYVAGWSRYLRSSMLGALRSDFVRTARAKGLSERRVVWVHALRNAMVPVVSVIALETAGLFSGAIITETVFAWPGIGRLFVLAMTQRDYPVLMGILLLGAVMVILFNLLADLVYGWLDPRIRYE